MVFDYRNFKFHFTEVRPLSEYLPKGMLDEGWTKDRPYLEAVCSDKGLQLGFSSATPCRSRWYSMVETASKGRPTTEQRNFGLAFELWYKWFSVAVCPAVVNKCANLFLCCKSDIALLTRRVKIPNIQEYAEWLLDNSIDQCGATDPGEWGTLRAEFMFGTEAARHLHFDPTRGGFLPTRFDHFYDAPAGIDEEELARFILDATAVENGFDVFGDKVDGVFMLELTIPEVKPSVSAHEKILRARAHRMNAGPGFIARKRDAMVSKRRAA